MICLMNIYLLTYL
jgi:Spore coat polysaccharide biosynthesis protein, predicted glycosyltransferase